MNRLRTMGIWALLLHLGNFVLPAVALAAGLAVGVAGLPGRRFWRVWALLSLLGVAVLAGGLVFFGVDGKMATYAALALATGSAAWWLRGRA